MYSEVMAAYCKRRTEYKDIALAKCGVFVALHVLTAGLGRCRFEFRLAMKDFPGLYKLPGH
jgi:hypothetical protein